MIPRKKGLFFFKICIYTLSLFIFEISYSQIIYKQSFEDFSSLPKKKYDFEIIGVFNPSSDTCSTPDYFHRNAENKKLRPYSSYHGRVEPINGDAVIGLVLGSNKDKKYTEYASLILNDTIMQKGKLYDISLSINTASKHKRKIGKADSIGILFTTEKPYQYRCDPIKHPPQITFALNKSGNEWLTVNAKLKYESNYKFCTIGFFGTRDELYFPKTDDEIFAYYFIDMFKIEETKSETLPHAKSINYENTALVSKKSKDTLNQKTNVTAIESPSYQESSVTFLLDLSGSLKGVSKAFADNFNSAISSLKDRPVNYSILGFNETTYLFRDNSTLDKDIDVNEIVGKIEHKWIKGTAFVNSLHSTMAVARKNYEKGKNNLIVICSDFIFDKSDIEYLKNIVDENKNEFQFHLLHYDIEGETQFVEDLNEFEGFFYQFQPLEQFDTVIRGLLSYYYIKVLDIQAFETEVKFITSLGGVELNEHVEYRLVQNNNSKRIFFDTENWIFSQQAIDKLKKNKSIKMSFANNEMMVFFRQNFLNKILKKKGMNPVVNVGNNEIVVFSEH